jgi:hypothetical protein
MSSHRDRELRRKLLTCGDCGRGGPRQLRARDYPVIVLFDLDDADPDYRLVWPRGLFVDELRSIIDRGGQADLLLEEAFAGDAPRRDLNRLGWRELGLAAPGWTGGDDDAPSPGAFLKLLVDNADKLLEYRPSSPYWSQRTQAGAENAAAVSRDRIAVRQDWAALIGELRGRGYLDKVAPRHCVDDREAEEPEVALDRAIRLRLGVPGLWPLRPDWSDDTLYSLIEVFHDLVARPRSRTYHDFSDCGFHYADFAYKPAQRLYRWRVNEILVRTGIDLELAETGEDTGRLVHFPADPRRELFRSALASGTPAVESVRHAIALFRARGAGREEKRSACVALAAVLEQRRNQIKSELLTKDEGALFHIANQFDVRHRNANQQSDYDEIYLDWVFWWYLATVELTERLAHRSWA